MENNIEKLKYDIEKMHDSTVKKMVESKHNKQKVVYWSRMQAFSEVIQLITDILNSENPNSVSNQPTEE
jgi:hypothetical protein